MTPRLQCTAQPAPAAAAASISMQSSSAIRHRCHQWTTDEPPHEVWDCPGTQDRCRLPQDEMAMPREEALGCFQHPSVAAHRAMADVVAATVAKALGW